MKIILSNNTSFEITDEVITIEEFLMLAERLKDLAIVSRTRTFGQPQPQEVVQEEQQPQPQNMSELPIEDRIYQLKLEGNQLSQIAKAFNITTSQARRLYQKVYQREWTKKKKNRERDNKTKKTKGKQRAPIRSRWDNREEVLKVLKAHYFGTQKDKEEFVKIKGKSWNDITKSLWNLTKRYKIKPAELGLTKWGKPRGKNDLYMNPKTKKVLMKHSVDVTNDIPTTPKSGFAQESLNIAEKQFVEFFTNYMQKGGFEDELKQAILLLREWLKSQGRTGSVQDVMNFLGTKVKSLKPIIQPQKLEEWFK